MQQNEQLLKHLPEVFINVLSYKASLILSGQ